MAFSHQEESQSNESDLTDLAFSHQEEPQSNPTCPTEWEKHQAKVKRDKGNLAAGKAKMEAERAKRPIKCPFEGCPHRYKSQITLREHLKNKHP